jgi:hydroxymethylpyrimidine pyrophosphatase-like HAD family hydrolase
MKDQVDDILSRFLEETHFNRAGAIMTDLDGTAVHEFEGRIAIPDPVSHGLKLLRDRGCPVLLNSLRFPLNVIKTFGREWYAISNAPLPLVSLNGSLIGYLKETAQGEITFEEIVAFPLAAIEIEKELKDIDAFLSSGVDRFVLFIYPRDWTKGELIWTPSPDRIAALQLKYPSASAVISSSVDDLRGQLLAEPHCMLFLLIESSGDKLMAYQHARKSSFVTRDGIDKLWGAKALANALSIDLTHAIGAGDTPMDTFLKGVGLAIHVGPINLEYRGISATLKLKNALEFGAVLFRLAELQREKVD